ncbi:MAG: T9SS type A sorting domain-containing protein [Ignavibacteria bacterium]|nr:T9SS type A sorting domain-containing protein [Ignavibacteria bacterium]
MIKYLFIVCSVLIFVSVSHAGWFFQTSPVSSDLYSVNFNHGNDNIVWACGEDGVILYSSNGGVNWILQNSGTTNDLFAIVFMEISGGPVYACGENGIILRTSDNGFNWTIVPSPSGKTLRDISDFNFLTVGESGVILKSTNEGLNWFAVSSPTIKNLYAVSGTFGYYAVGEDGIILKGISQGMSWDISPSGVTNNLYGVPLFGSTNITVGQNGLILRSTNFGGSWYSQNSLTQKTIRSVEFSVNNTSRIYCVGDSGLILKTTNEGVDWGFQHSGTDKDLNSVFFYLNDNIGYAVGDNGTILKTTDGGGLITSAEAHPGLENIPSGYTLRQNYPNPFNPNTQIRYLLSENGLVRLKIYDVLGDEVAVLVNEKQNKGNYSYQLSTVNYQLSSGIYFYRLEVDGMLSEAKRMVLLK